MENVNGLVTGRCKSKTDHVLVWTSRKIDWAFSQAISKGEPTHGRDSDVGCCQKLLANTIGDSLYAVLLATALLVNCCCQAAD